MNLYLVRHAVAETRDPTRWPDDGDRPLSKRGVRAFEDVAKLIRRLDIPMDVVLASRYSRAWATAEILRARANWPAPRPHPQLEPDVDPMQCLASIREVRAESVALVGHEPQLSRLASLLVSGPAAPAELELKKGGIVCLALDEPAAVGNARLRWSVSSRLVRTLAGKTATGD